MNRDIDDILKTGDEQLIKLGKIVTKAIAEEKLITENLVNQPKEILSKGQTISDQVAIFGGSWKFIISFSAILSIWILFNTFGPKSEHFDPYPFILMNLVLSAIAALQAPIIICLLYTSDAADE